jgi:RNA polymerase sigma-70 factor (ECF subfamily)
MSDGHTANLERWLDRLKAGDPSARDELLNHACERLRKLTHTMLRDYRRLQRWEETDDVCQNAMLRLHRSLQHLRPPSPRDFYRLAATQIRRELIDLARHHFGPEGQGPRHATNADARSSHEAAEPLYDRADDSSSPEKLARWSEFHRQVDALPEEEQEVFELIWYQGLTHTEAAALLNVSAKTVKRRWQAACLRLHEALHGDLPGS